MRPPVGAVPGEHRLRSAVAIQVEEVRRAQAPGHALNLEPVRFRPRTPCHAPTAGPEARCDARAGWRSACRPRGRDADPGKTSSCVVREKNQIGPPVAIDVVARIR